MTSTAKKKQTQKQTQKRKGTQKKRKGKGKRTILCQDSLPWLERHAGTLDTIVTSIPEWDEVDSMEGMKTLKGYKAFFQRAAALCLRAVKPTGYVIFLQTDRKYKGWIDKSHWLSEEAEKLEMRMIWHKIALRTVVGKADLYRPTYSHMVCYSAAGKIGVPTANVVHRGPVTYPNAFGVDAVRHVLESVRAQLPSRPVIVDPFVGSGTVVAVANALGMDAIGIDLDTEQCKLARTSSISF